MKRLSFVVRMAAFAALIALCLTGQTKKHAFTPHDKAFYASKALVDFVNPGLTITINSAAIASNGTINVTYTLTDPNGLPLDATGATTPGVISLAYVAGLHPQGPGTICRLHDCASDRRGAGHYYPPGFRGFRGVQPTLGRSGPIPIHLYCEGPRGI